MAKVKSSLLKNSIYNVLYKCLNILFPFITSVYVARILQAESIGRVAAAQNIVQYFTLLAAMGIPTYGIKVIAQNKTGTEEMNRRFSELFIINFVLSILSTLIYYLIIIFVPYFNGKEVLYYVVGLQLVFNVFNVDWFYQGIEQYKYIAFRSFVIKVLSLLSMFMFVRRSNDYIIYALISTGALVGNYIFNIIRIRKYVKLILSQLSYKEHIKHIMTLFIASIAAEVYVLADTTMLDVMCSSSIVGYYSMSMRIIKILRAVVVAIAAVFLPKLSSLYHVGKREEFLRLANQGLHILITLSLPVAIGLGLVADDAISFFFGNGYLESITTTRILSFSIISVAISNFIGMQLLVTIGKERITTISTIVGAITNVILNYFLIKKYQHVGAAVASAFTEILVTVIQIVLARKYIVFKFGGIKPILATATMGIAVLIIHLIRMPILVRIMVEICFGGIVYLGLLSVMKDELIVLLKNSLSFRTAK